MAQINRLTFFLASRCLTVLVLLLLKLSYAFSTDEVLKLGGTLVPLTAFVAAARFMREAKYRKFNLPCNLGFCLFISFLVLLEYTVFLLLSLAYFEVATVITVVLGLEVLIGLLLGYRKKDLF